jgi:hypothetical protein
MHCSQCSHEINIAHGLPPWCSHCGADLKSFASPAPRPAPEAPDHGGFRATIAPVAEPAGESWSAATASTNNRLQDGADAGADGNGCPSCGTPAEIPDWAEERVAWYCPECGQCLKAPAPWAAPAVASGQCSPCWSSCQDRAPPAVAGISVLRRRSLRASFGSPAPTPAGDHGEAGSITYAQKLARACGPWLSPP